MATTIEPASATSARDGERRLYLQLAIACAGVALLGFAPTYWAPLAAGKLKAHPLIHLHGMVFFAWSGFLVFQTWLATSRRIIRHRSVGLIGISLATAMAILGIATAVNRMHWAASLGQAEAGRAFAIVPVFAIAFFAATFATAVANVRRPDWHKRLMLLAAVSILDAPIARWFIVFLAPDAPPGPPPVAVDIGPSLVSLVLIAIAAAADWRRLGRPHTAFLTGALALVALKLIQVPLSATGAWQSFAEWLMAFGA